MINYEIIATSVHHYEAKGFKRIESPWTITKEVSDITKPVGAREFQLVHDNDKVLVASGEQSFLYLFLKGFLPHGMYQTITPCWRFENFDALHTKYFIKNELIKTDVVTERALEETVWAAHSFFSRYLPASDIKTVQLGTNTYDINYKDVELGSYGIRKCDFLTWIYGTGVAEPRLSQVMMKYGIPYQGN